MGNEVGKEDPVLVQQRNVHGGFLPRLLGRGSEDGASEGSWYRGGGPSSNGGEEGTRTTFRHLYMLQDRIGTGSHSQVFRAIERESGRQVAVKVIHTDTAGWLDRHRRHLAFLRAEIFIHQEVSGHPFVVDLLGVFEDPEGCFIVEELAKGGSLLDHMHSRASLGTEGEVRLLLRRLLEACRFLHHRDIVHRDIKKIRQDGRSRIIITPENILVMEEGVMHSGKLGDFGFATRLDHHRLRHPSSPPTTTAVGTPEYVSPEILLQQPFDGRADVWSMGVTAFCLLSGAMPFRGLTLDKLYTAVLDGACSYAGREWSGVSPRAQDMVRRMLVVDPEDRWTSEELLEHPWLMEGGPTRGMGAGAEVKRLGLGRRGRVRLKTLALAVVFFNRLRVAVVLGRRVRSGRSLRSLEQELGSP
ncbi:unnamed protein product [Scytosiphon promiscuus]